MDRPLKKTETIEIRIPYETKAAFMARCRDDGVTASESLRAHIADRLEGPSSPAGSDRRPWRLAGGLALALGVAAAAAPSVAGTVERIAFDQLDQDGGGGVSLAELSRGARVEVGLQLRGSGLTIRRAEVGASGEPAVAGDQALHDALVRREFERLDADGDGAVSFREFRSR